jgi:hypothetical protein
MTLINNQPGKRGLTEEGKQTFEMSYNSLETVAANRPMIRFPRQAADDFSEISKLRMKSWGSTNRWCHAADETGLIAEIACQRYFDIAADQAMASFLQALEKGDRGHDIEIAGIKIDVKGTRGDALRFKMSKQNRFAHLADAYLFTYVQPSGMETRAFLLGWAYRAEIKPFLRDDGVKLVVRVETLRRQQILKPVSMLREANFQTISTHTLPTH